MKIETSMTPASANLRQSGGQRFLLGSANCSGGLSIVVTVVSIITLDVLSKMDNARRRVCAVYALSPRAATRG
jgi:hypothetical protein